MVGAAYEGKSTYLASIDYLLTLINKVKDPNKEQLQHHVEQQLPYIKEGMVDKYVKGT